LIYFIVNPNAGSGKGKETVPIIEKIMRENDMEYSVIFTNKSGDLARVSELIDMNKAKAIVCVGGDGTVQEYVGLAVEKNVNFGIIPVGSGNDFLYSVPGNTPKFDSFEEKIKFYAKKIIGGKVIHTDAVAVNGDKYFFNIGGTGIDIQVLKDALPLKKKFAGAAYFLSLIKNAATYNASEITLTVDGVSERDVFLLLAICNGAYYGGHMRIAPPALIDDGFITLCITRNMSRLKRMVMFPSVKSGAHSKLKEVSFQNCSSVKLEFEGTKTINLDGNLVEFESPLTFEIMKGAVNFIV